MIIGNGSIAKLLNDREGVVFVAAGVSNSQMHGTAEDVLATIRESLMMTGIMMQCLQGNLMLVYFSTISVFTIDSFYTKYKLGMEKAIRETGKNYTIIRIGNIWECTNPNTFINAYKAKPYEPRDEYKYMISKEQLNFVTDNLPLTGKHEISIFGQMLKVKECLKR